jgi:death-on-curing protein
VRYLTVDEVSQTNESLVGPRALADFGLLESAVMRPQQSIFGGDAYPSIHDKAGALLHSLARNHPFVDGNKRTALLATVIFYAKNGWLLQMEQDSIIAVVM